MTDRIETLKSLQQRIRTSTGPDRDLDALIYAWRHNAVSLGYSSIDHGWVFEYPAGKDCIENEDLTRYTTDPDGLGACVSLLNAVLPGVEWSRDTDGEFWLWRETGSPQQEIGWISHSSKIANDCLTFIDAIISAAIAQLEAQEAVG